MGFFKWLTDPLVKIFGHTTDIMIELDSFNSSQNIGVIEHNGIVEGSGLKENKNLYRPRSFKEYIGQTNAKELLKAFISGTKARNKVFPHLLIHGSAGCGKTTLAKIIAQELNLPFKEIISSQITRSWDIISKVLEVDGGILFLDEIHGIDRSLVEPLYPILEDFSVDGKNISPFTLIGATTEIGEIIKTRRPFYDRFKIKIELEDYNTSEMTIIVKQYFKHTFPNEKIDNKYALNIIAKNSRLIPRFAISLLEATIYLNGDVYNALKTYNIISCGYTFKDLKILKYLEKSNATGIQALSSFIGTSKENYTYDIEPWLLRNQLIVRTPRGRKITDSGILMIKKLERKIQ